MNDALHRFSKNARRGRRVCIFIIFFTKLMVSKGQQTCVFLFKLQCRTNKLQKTTHALHISRRKQQRKSAAAAAAAPAVGECPSLGWMPV